MSSAPTRPPAGPAAPRPNAPAPAPASGMLNVSIDPIKLLRQNWLWLGLAGVLGVVLGVAAHFALLRFSPIFTARAYFQVAGLLENADATNSSIGTSEDEIDRYIQSQVARMMSDDILRNAAADPQIQQETKWSRQFLSQSGQYDPVEAFLSLKDIVNVRSMPETNYIMLSASASNRTDAETIARVVSNKYRQSLDAERTQGQLDIQQSLTNQLNAIQEERLLLEDRMKRLLRDNNLTTLDERLTNERMVLEGNLPVLQETRYTLGNLREQLAILEEQLNAPGGANFPELVRSTVRQNPIITTFVQRIADLNASLRGARETFGPNHRSVKSLERSIASTEDEMKAQEEQLLGETFTQYIEQVRTQIRTLTTIEAEAVGRIEQAQTRQSELQAVLEDYNMHGEDLGRLADRETQLESRIAEARALQDRSDSRRVKQIQAPVADERPTFPKLIIVVPAVTLLVSGFVGGLIFLRELLEQRVRGPADLVLIPRLRIAGVIPDLSEDPSKPPAMETAVLDRPQGVVTEAIRNVRIDILKKFGAAGHKTLLVAGGMPRSGATSFAVNFARSCSACELRTLIIDANLRRPAVHDATGTDVNLGLGDVLEGSASFDEAIQSTGNGGPDVLTAGSASHRIPERLITQAFSDLLVAAKSRYDLVVIDSPPAIVSSDAFSIAARCDASLLIIRAYAEKRGLVTRLRSRFEEANAEFMGVVVNGVRAAAGGYFRKNYLETHRYSKDAMLADASSPGSRGKKSKGKRSSTTDDSTPDG